MKLNFALRNYYFFAIVVSSQRQTNTYTTTNLKRSYQYFIFIVAWPVIAFTV